MGNRCSIPPLSGHRAQTQSGGGPVSRPSLSFHFPALFLQFLFMPFVHFPVDDPALEFGGFDALFFCTEIEPLLLFHREPCGDLSIVFDGRFHDDLFHFETDPGTWFFIDHVMSLWCSLWNNACVRQVIQCRFMPIDPAACLFCRERDRVPSSCFPLTGTIPAPACSFRE